MLCYVNTMNICFVYKAHMSPALSGSLALECVKLGDVLEIRDGMIFKFYLGLPHIYVKESTVES